MNPDYHCIECSWAGDEPQECPHCHELLCPECFGEVENYSAWLENQRVNDRDEYREDMRLLNDNTV